MASIGIGLGDRRRCRRHRVGDPVVAPVLAGKHEVRAGKAGAEGGVLDEGGAGSGQ
jgi:hypothetical protein